MPATKTKPARKPADPVTGTYRYDRATGEIVLVSAGVPKVASKGKKSARPADCGAGACAPRRGGGCGGPCGA